MGSGITDELREYAGMWENSVQRYHLFAIADSIDKEYEKALAERSESLASMTNKSAVDDYRVLLPVDADGVPIHVGDTLLGCNNDTSVVKGLTLSKSGWELVCDNGIWHDPSIFIHYHKPSVEDILQEFGDEAYMGCDTKETILEFANRIREAVRDEQ